MVLWYGPMLETMRSNWEAGDNWVDERGREFSYDGNKWREVKDGVEEGS